MQALHKQEQRRLREQIRLDSLKNANERNQLGQFATPPKLAVEIIELALKHRRDREEDIHFLDPGFGTGAFYSALLRTIDRTQIESAVGVEIDPLFAQTARTLWEDYGLQLIEADFAQLRLTAVQTKPNVIISNPPYIRHHHLDQKLKLTLQDRAFKATGCRPSGLSGLYCYFLLIAHQWLQHGGLSVWLIPTEFMDVNYGEAIRTYLTQNVTLKQLHRFEATDVQFADALVSSAVVVFEKTTPSPQHKVTFTIGGTPTQPDQTFHVPIRQLKKERKWTRAHRTHSKAKTNSYRDLFFGDLFEARRGIATGANEFFVLEREKAEEWSLPHAFYRPILPSPRHLTNNIVSASEDGYPRITPQLVLLDCNLREDQVRKEHPTLWEYLEYGKSRGFHKRYLTSRRNPWYQQEQRPHTPFLCTYMGRSQNNNVPFRFIWNQSAATIPNVYLLLYPREPLATYLSGSHDREYEIFELLMEISTKTLVDEGRTYGGGLHKIEPKELHRVSLSDIPLARRLFAASTLF